MAAAKHIPTLFVKHFTSREAKNGLSSNLTNKPQSQRKLKAPLREAYLAADRVHSRKGLTKQAPMKDKPRHQAVVPD